MSEENLTYDDLRIRYGWEKMAHEKCREAYRELLEKCDHFEKLFNHEREAHGRLRAQYVELLGLHDSLLKEYNKLIDETGPDLSEYDVK